MIRGNIEKMVEHSNREVPGFGCISRLAKDSLNHARMYAEHTGDDDYIRDTEKIVEDVKAYERAYWKHQRIRNAYRFCKTLEFVSWGVVVYCMPECLPAARAATAFRLCPVAP